jgi:hypothetical protein
VTQRIFLKIALGRSTGFRSKQTVCGVFGDPKARVIRLNDGHAKSGYRRFTDALKAALRLKDQFPDHNVKVRAIRASHSSHK